ncbi:MAG TPA: hypothetical protein VM778_01900 [Gemmatimonadota bacterium]|nr:hypothetical protein [Gemmatimonadota bacterium]
MIAVPTNFANAGEGAFLLGDFDRPEGTSAWLTRTWDRGSSDWRLEVEEASEANTSALESPQYPLSLQEAAGARFRRLSNRWRDETAIAPSVVHMALHDAYQQIIGMGEDALPLILAELQTNGGHWFWALSAITGEDPVPDAARGEIEAMTEAWLEWGRVRGFA